MSCEPFRYENRSYAFPMYTKIKTIASEKGCQKQTRALIKDLRDELNIDEDNRSHERVNDATSRSRDT
jgi:hypothetical protein